jgi:hypothetical protein
MRPISGEKAFYDRKASTIGQEPEKPLTRTLWLRVDARRGFATVFRVA